MNKRKSDIEDMYLVDQPSMFQHPEKYSISIYAKQDNSLFGNIYVSDSVQRLLLCLAMCVFPRRIEILAYILHDIDHGHKNMIFATKDGAVFKGNMHEDDYVYLLTSPLCPQWGPPNCTGKATHPPPVSHTYQDPQRYRQLNNRPK